MIVADIKMGNMNLLFIEKSYLQPSFHELHAVVVTCIQDSWTETAVKGFEHATFGLVFCLKLEKASSLEVSWNF